MRIKVLMVSDKGIMPVTDAVMLKERGFWVYTCNNGLVNEMVTEVKPDIVFFNPEQPDSGNTKAYQNLLHNNVVAHIPVIYTLAEDDMYLVHLKRNKCYKQNMVTGSIIEGIKLSLLAASMPKEAITLHYTGYSNFNRA
jgi:response regulator RpfG family c-di-GMP phosphodiesterase